MTPTPLSESTGLGSALDWLDRNQPEVVALFQRIVDIDSPSSSPAGVAAVHEVLAGFLQRCGVGTRRIELADGRQALLGGEASGAGTVDPVLLLGHVDTVHAAGSAARRPFRVDGGRAYGPGAGDMKGGVAIMAAVLAAGAGRWPIQALFVPDEEIGSPYSRDLTHQLAAGARAVFCLEGSRAGGTVVTRRAGARMLTLRATGRPAHSARPEEGANAIDGMVRLIPLLQAALSDPARVISVNVGLIRGGEAVNTIAPRCEIELCIRHRDPEDWNGLQQRLEQVLAAPVLPGVEFAIIRDAGFPPLRENPGTDALLAAYLSACAEEGQTVEVQSRGGASDAANAAQSGTPTLCGTGAISAGAHTDHEYADIGSLLPRARILIRCIDRLMQGSRGH